MKKIKLIGKTLSREEMKRIGGGVATDWGCTALCIISYEANCNTIPGTTSEFCSDQAEAYCVPFCNPQQV